MDISSIQCFLDGLNKYKIRSRKCLVGVFVATVFILGTLRFGGSAEEARSFLPIHELSKRSAQSNSLSPFTLKEIVKNEFSPSKWNGSWHSDTEYVYKDQPSGSLNIRNLETQTTEVLVPGKIMNGRPRVFKFLVSPDKKFVLLAFRPQKLFRHSFLATYDIYEVATGRKISLSPSDEILGRIGRGPPSPPNGPERSSPPKPLLYVTWSHEGHSLAYVFANNIFYRPTPESEDVPITTTGEPGVVFNGVADWVYEEEVISDTRALWFSPDGKHVAWIEFNDTAVDMMPLELYGPPSSLEFQYPIATPIKYPKPGRANPFVNVYAARLDPRASAPLTVLLMEPPAYFYDKERIIYAVTWATNSELSLTWENRHQNYSVVSICDVELASCVDSLVMTESRGWIELDAPPVFTKSGRQFSMPLSADGYVQVNVINRDTNQRIPITSGQMAVTKISHWDEKSHKIYFVATRPGAPGERHLHTVTDFESGRPGLVDCLSCDVENTRGGSCGYNTFSFSNKFTYYSMSCLGPHVPQDFLFKKDPKRRIEILETNDYLTNELIGKRLPKVSNLDVPILNGKYFAKVRLYLPPDFDERKKYPLLVNVYGAPNSQQVNDRFKLDWGTYLSTNEDVIYALIDGRGSGYQGNDFLYEIYYNLGTVEVQDQINVTQKLIDQYSFIDRNNVAIWGWSYGGFVTTSVLAADADQNNIFKCGIAVAPVTNWIYYDTVYTERYMGLPIPSDNLKGYIDSDVTAKAKKFKNKKLLIVHGTADDNVHYQQSMMLTRALEEADVLFQQLSYPDEAHSISGLRPHFFHSLTNFIINDCFQKNEIF